MDFRVKCAIQQVFSIVPGGRKLNYLMQRYVTKSLPVSGASLAELRRLATRHLEDYEAAFARKPQVILDFGCGWDLGIPILMAQRSGARVIAADIEPGMSRYLVNDILNRVGISSLEAARIR